MPEIRILVASPSQIARNRLAMAVSNQPGLDLVAQTSDLSETYMAAEALEPHVVMIAREFADLAEFGGMVSLFEALNADCIVVTSGAAARHRTVAVPALGRRRRSRALAMDLLLPADQICAEIRALRGAARRGTPLTPASAAPLPVMPGPAVIPDLRARPRQNKVILIGASTGGVDALLTVVSALPADCPPTAIVQHTGQGFSDGLIKLLDRRCAAEVRAVTDGLEMRPGRICVAAGAPGHFRLIPGRPMRCSVQAGPPISGHVPSVDALFHSAVPFGGMVIAALLTGMGRDGADGLLALRNAGAMTIGQDEATSVVYGMPKAAFDIGAVQHQLRLHDVAATIMRACLMPTRTGSTRTGSAKTGSAAS